MNENISRTLINALMPDGQVWTPALNSDYDKFLDGIAENSEAVRLALSKLKDIRNPHTTPLLSDLEKEFGIIPTAGSSETLRRAILASFMFRKNHKPTYENLQRKLRNADFDVYVYPGSRLVDPADFLNEAFQMTAGDLLPDGSDAQAGETEAYAGRVGGELLVNGDEFDMYLDYTVLAGEADALAGEADAVAGDYSGIGFTLKEYPLPTDPGYWPLIFYVSGEATRDAVTGEIITLDIAQIPIQREAEFKKLILQEKPLSTWAALVCAFQ